MARIQRQELKKDEFVDTFEETLLWVEDRARTLALVGLIVLVGGGSIGGFYWYGKKQEAKAGAALAAALNTFQAQVQAGLPALPGEGQQRTFTSKEEKFKAAAEEFAAVQKSHPRTRAARMAQQYEAWCQFELGHTDEAVKSLEELTRSSDRNQAALAKLTLAGFYRDLSKPEEAAKLLRELADNPAATVPRSTALMELAALQERDNPAEARRLYNEIKNESPDTALATEITRRLELLPATAPAEPEPASVQP